jgi:hypothetical protein
MSARQTWVLATAVVLAALILGAFLGPRTAAQRAEQPKPEVAAGRYQAVHLASNGSLVLVLDTATGRCWTVDPDQPQDDLKWKDQGSPPRPNK